MATEADFYRCSVCGNLVTLLNVGGGTLTCCGKTMVKLEPNSTDAAKEKHVPVVTREGGKIKVQVGSTPHPMLSEHYIQWIALASEGNLQIAHLKPGQEPKAEFGEVDSGTVYAYCNLHSLWKANF